MANNYYDATGVLVLDKVTPVITALFGAFNLDESYPGDGEVYIAQVSEDNDVSWDAVSALLCELVESLELFDDIVDVISLTMPETILALAKHFQCEEDPVIQHMLENGSFQDDADPADLFQLAQRFDDGHALRSIRWEGAWHCSRPRLFEFGGNGWFIGEHCEVATDSTRAGTIGGGLDRALGNNNLDDAATVLSNAFLGLLNGVRDESVRADLKARVLAKLAF